MAASAASIEGLDAFVRELKRIDPNFGKEMRKLNATVARRVRDRARGIASGMNGSQSHFAGDIRSAASQRDARLFVTPRANAAFWGAKKHTGWYAEARYFGARRDGTPVADTAQHPKWVGASWTVGVRGQGPYAINDAIASLLPWLDNEYLEMVDDLARRAFPQP